MKTYTKDTINNQDQSYYDRVAHDLKKEIYVKEGDFIVLRRPSYYDMNYVFHMGRLRFIGMY